MFILKSATNWIKKLAEEGLNLLAPEDAKIKRLLSISAGEMKEWLPKSAVYSKNIFVLFDYDNKIVKQIIRWVKYKNNRSLRKRVAAYLYEELLEIYSDLVLFEGAPPLLVPMPMSKKEKKARGFNQCEELVMEIKKLGGDNIEVSYNTLKKVRETKRQTKLSKEERQENVKGSMRAFLGSKTTIKTQCPEQSEGEYFLKNKTVIVLDDVYTTGASLFEAQRALLSSGARRVIGLFIAH